MAVTLPDAQAGGIGSEKSAGWNDCTGLLIPDTVLLFGETIFREIFTASISYCGFKVLYIIAHVGNNVLGMEVLYYPLLGDVRSYSKYFSDTSHTASHMRCISSSVSR